jgi:hypothetical protein
LFTAAFRVTWQVERSRVLETKQGSWVWLAGQVAEFPDNADWTGWKVFVLALLQACIHAGLDRHFRAGMAMHDIIFSTAEEHGLEKYHPPPPRVTLTFNHESQQ